MRWSTRVGGVVVALISVAAMLTLAACAPSPAAKTPTGTMAATGTASVRAGATVTLRASSFGVTSVTISAGQAVAFVDPASGGGTHQLCLGANEVCDDAAQGPSDLLDPGLILMPGMTKSVLFTQAGSYAVTCALHPNMQLTISVLGTGG